MYVHKHELYLLAQHSESFEICSGIMRIYTEGKSLIMKLSLVDYTNIVGYAHMSSCVMYMFIKRVYQC